MKRETKYADLDGPHNLPLAQQRHRHVIVGRRLGDSSDLATVVLAWDAHRRAWVFYLHANARMAACFTDSDVRAAAQHVLDAKERTE